MKSKVPYTQVAMHKNFITKTADHETMLFICTVKNSLIVSHAQQHIKI